jgi:hypothetical protein
MIHITGAYNRYHVDEGNEIYNAVVLASRERVKAVFITSLIAAVLFFLCNSIGSWSDMAS